MSRPSRFELIGGHPVLDLVNTVAWRGNTARRVEHLPDFAALLAWSARAGVISAAELDRAAAAASSVPGSGEHALADTLLLRERLHSVLTGVGPRRQRAAEIVWPQLTAALRHARPAGLPLQPTIELREPD